MWIQFEAGEQCTCNKHAYIPSATFSCVIVFSTISLYFGQRLKFLSDKLILMLLLIVATRQPLAHYGAEISVVVNGNIT